MSNDVVMQTSSCEICYIITTTPQRAVSPVLAGRQRLYDTQSFINEPMQQYSRCIPSGLHVSSDSRPPHHLCLASFVFPCSNPVVLYCTGPDYVAAVSQFVQVSLSVFNIHNMSAQSYNSAIQYSPYAFVHRTDSDTAFVLYSISRTPTNYTWYDTIIL